MQSTGYLLGHLSQQMLPVSMQCSSSSSEKSVHHDDTFQECTGKLNIKQETILKKGKLQYPFPKSVLQCYVLLLQGKQANKNVASWLFRIMKLQSLLSLQNMKFNRLCTLITVDYLLYLHKSAFTRLSFIISESLPVVIHLVNMAGSRPWGQKGDDMMAKQQLRRIALLVWVSAIYPPILQSRRTGTHRGRECRSVEGLQGQVTLKHIFRLRPAVCSIKT